MGTRIEWTDQTWNPLIGCSKVSSGCKSCYAVNMANRLQAMGVRGYDGVVARHKNGMLDWTGKINLVPERLDLPLRWKKPRRVFVNSESDLFHEDVPDAFIDQVFAVMALASNHTFQVLTKRQERMLQYLSDEGPALKKREIRVGDADGVQWQTGVKGRLFKYIVDSKDGKEWRATHPFGDIVGRGGLTRWPLPNIWIGVSVENQATADERIPLLLQTPAAVRFVSYEPALGPVDFGRWLSVPSWSGDWDNPVDYGEPPLLDQVIIGGESGPHARPFDLAWARSTIAQCQAAGVSVFVKQLGAKPVVAYYNSDDDLREWALDHRNYVETPYPNGKRGRWNHALDGQPHPLSTIVVGLRDRKGGDMAEWPEDLRVRESPQ